MNKFFAVAFALVMVALLYLLKSILTPFLVGALLAYLFNPVVNQLMRLHIPRVLAVIIVFLIFIVIVTLLMLLVVPLIQEQIQHLMDSVPNIMDWLQNTLLPSVQEYFGSQQLIDVNSLKKQVADNLTKAGGAAGWLVSAAVHSGYAILHWLLNVILTFVVMFYLLVDWEKVVKGVRSLIPHCYEHTVIKLIKDCNEVIGAFFRGQLLVMLTLGAMYSVGLSLVGLQFGLVIGVIVGLLSIVPYLGVTIGIIIASIAAYAQYGDYTAILSVLAVFAVGQTLDGMFITPKLVGGRIGLHPVAVIFAVLAGAVLFGFFGVLLALPVAAVIMVLARFVNTRYHTHSHG